MKLKPSDHQQNVYTMETKLSLLNLCPVEAKCLENTCRWSPSRHRWWPRPPTFGIKKILADKSAMKLDFMKSGAKLSFCLPVTFGAYKALDCEWAIQEIWIISEVSLNEKLSKFSNFFHFIQFSDNSLFGSIWICGQPLFGLMVRSRRTMSFWPQLKATKLFPISVYGRRTPSSWSWVKNFVH